MKTIILDTNFLMMPASLGVDIFSEIDRICDFSYELCVVDKTLSELENIREEQPGKHKMAAKLGLRLIKAKALKIITTPQDKSVDQLIINMVNSRDYIVATNDGGLKRRLKAKKIPLILLRQKKYLSLGE